ncbi:MAG: prolipoprotein diacylglyceryl transferase [Anaerolineae bacterium]
MGETGGPRIAFRIGPIAIAWYGILIVVSAMVAAFLAEREAKRRGENPEHVWNALLLCLILGMIGARLYHVISSLDYYRQYPMEIFNTRHGGLAIYGAVAGGALAVWIYTRRYHLNFGRWADIATPGLFLAQAIARWGNYLNQELYGYPTTLPWGITIDAAHRIPPFTDLTKYPLTTRFHPTFLYESLGNLVNFALITYISRRYADRLKDGDLILCYGILYPLLRFFVEFQRPDAWKIAGVATAQWIAIASIILCSALLIYRHRARPAKATSDSEGEA